MGQHNKFHEIRKPVQEVKQKQNISHKTYTQLQLQDEQNQMNMGWGQGNCPFCSHSALQARTLTGHCQLGPAECSGDIEPHQYKEL